MVMGKRRKLRAMLFFKGMGHVGRTSWKMYVCTTTGNSLGQDRLGKGRNGAFVHSKWTRVEADPVNGFFLDVPGWRFNECAVVWVGAVDPAVSLNWCQLVPVGPVRFRYLPVPEKVTKRRRSAGDQSTNYIAADTHIELSAFGDILIKEWIVNAKTKNSMY